MEPHQINQITSTLSTKLVRASIVVAIVIVMNMLFNYAASLAFKEPVYDEYIKATQVIAPPTTKDSCIAVGGQWNETLYPNTVQPVKETQPKVEGYCNENYTNDIIYQNALKIYEKKVFVFLLLLGVVSLVIGVFIGISLLAVAFTWGGVLSLIIASIHYWSVADNLFKVLILALALGLLIWLVVKKFSK
ncbi:MAG: hypothetical protein ACR2IQ_01640 [Minisyncoccia bacterium]